MSNSNQNRYYFLASTLVILAGVVFWNNSSIALDAEDHDHDHEHEEFGPLTMEQQKAAGIHTEAVRSGYLQNTILTNGKIALNGNHVAHVIPKLSGIVKEVTKNDGEDVQEGEVLVFLESSEIAKNKSAYLGALKKEKVALELFAMEQELKDKNMTTTQEFQAALKEAGAAQTELELARQKLYALGLELEEIENIENDDPSQLRFYAIKSPMTGTVLHRHATIGERLSSESEAFIVANLDHLWVEISVYPQDQSMVKKGSQVNLKTLDGKSGTAEIVYVNPVIDEETRKAKAIALLDNRDREWSPGSYVTVEVETNKQPLPIVVSKDAIQSIEGENCVFIEAENGFEIRSVQTGQNDGKRVEIISGISKGEKIATTNTFLLKADHLKNEAEHEH